MFYTCCKYSKKMNNRFKSAIQINLKNIFIITKIVESTNASNLVRGNPVRGNFVRLI